MKVDLSAAKKCAPCARVDGDCLDCKVSWWIPIYRRKKMFKTVIHPDGTRTLKRAPDGIETVFDMKFCECDCWVIRRIGQLPAIDLTPKSAVAPPPPESERVQRYIAEHKRRREQKGL